MQDKVSATDYKFSLVWADVSINLAMPFCQIKPMEADGMSRVYQMLNKSAVSKDFRQIGVLFAKKVVTLHRQTIKESDYVHI